MYRQLVEESQANVSEVSVRRYVAHLRGLRAREAYVPLEFPLGSMMQVDFGHADVILAGDRLSLPFIALRLMANSVSFAKMFTHAKLEAWMDGIGSGRSFFGGVPAKAMYDYVPRKTVSGTAPKNSNACRWPSKNASCVWRRKAITNDAPLAHRRTQNSWILTR